MNTVGGLVSVIVVNYNTGDVMRECIESLYNTEDPAKFELIIVDNNSPDNSREIAGQLANRFPNVSNIFNTEKVSFSEANNIGFSRARGEFILIMNPDIIFTMPCFEILKNSLRTSGFGALSPLLIGTDGKFQRDYFQRYPGIIQFVCFYSLFAKLFSRSEGLRGKYLHNGSIDENSGKLETAEQLPCAFYFTTYELFQKTGLMDPAFRLFFEDVDLSYRMSEIRPLAVDTSLRVTHLGGSSFKREDDYWVYGRFILGMLTFFRKHYSQGKYVALKVLATLNSRLILFSESILKLAGKNDQYRIRKHRYFLEHVRKES
ncbi:MAG: glycosyltransferase [Ignavibacteria bacterium]|nr:glycosyltransferase [Ignavibacteria bacterium]